MDFKNKNVLITGASAGIGKALAIILAKDVALIVLVARRLQKLEDLKRNLSDVNPNVKIILFGIDISIRENQIKMLNDLKNQQIELDILINNAGMGDESLFHKSDWEKAEQIMELNNKSVISLTHLIVPNFLKNPKNKGIVFIGSGGGIAWMASSLVYSASKHFITATAMILRAELKPKGIQVNLVCPGPVDTEFDKVAGIDKGMSGGPSQKTRISAEECAEDIIKGTSKDRAVIFPGAKISRLMKLYLLLPWWLRRKILENDAKKLYNN